MNLTKTIILSLSTLVLVGCSQSPEDAVYGMYDALSDGDIAGLQANATEGTSTMLAMAATMQCKANKADFDDETELVSFCLEQVFGDIDIDDVEVKEISDTRARAVVKFENNGQAGSEALDLIKQGDTWKVNISK